MDHVVGFYEHFMLTLHGDVLSIQPNLLQIYMLL